MLTRPLLSNVVVSALLALCVLVACASAVHVRSDHRAHRASTSGSVAASSSSSSSLSTTTSNHTRHWGEGWQSWLRAHNATVNATTMSEWAAMVAATPVPADSPRACVHGSSPLLGATIVCAFNRTTVHAAGGERDVFFALPRTPPPAAGYPTVIAYQGSFFPGQWYFSGAAVLPFGAYHQVALVEALLDAGYAVVAPNAPAGLFYWSNLPPFDTMISFGLWRAASPDHAVVERVVDGMSSGLFGGARLDRTHMHAMGISSGAYMTSRMAWSRTHQFRSLVLESGSFYYCGGPLCAPPLPLLPGKLPAAHPPTLFCHGDIDPIVPVETMWMYAADLALHGVAHKVVTDPLGMHQWIPACPRNALAWIEHYNALD